MHLLFLVLMGVCGWSGALGFPNGDVAMACTDMHPLHSPFTPQTTASPYRVTVNCSTYAPGDAITVTLMAAQNGTNFEGFMLQAQKVGSMGAVGYFTSRTTTQFKLHNCSNTQNSVISHASGDNKTQFVATWIAPLNLSLGNIEFCATFVRDYEVFWTMVTSRPVLSTANSAPMISKVSLNSMAFCLLSALGTVFGSLSEAIY